MSKYLEAILSVMTFTSEQSPLTLAEIGERLAARGLKPNRTTIMRTLKREGFDSEGSSPVKYFMNREVRNKVSVSFTPEEIQTLALILKFQQESNTTYISGMATNILTKILKTFSDENENLLKKSLDQFYFTSGIEGLPKSPDNELFKNLMHALKQRLSFECLYDSPYKKSSRKRHFLPLKMIYVSKTPYIYCKDLDDQKYKTLKIIRIKNLKLSEDRDESLINENEIENILKQGFGAFTGEQEISDITILIEKKSKFETYLMENMIHKSQKVNHSKGHVKLELRCPVSEELVRLLIGFKADIHEIKQPDFLDVSLSNGI